jgi:hypothetical protein
VEVGSVNNPSISSDLRELLTYIKFLIEIESNDEGMHGFEKRDGVLVHEARQRLGSHGAKERLHDPLARCGGC